MALTPPVISLLSATGTTLTVSFTADPLATDTTFYLMDPATGNVLMTSAGHVTPTAVIAGLTPQTAYDVVAVSFTNPGPSDFSPPSLSKPLRPSSWTGVYKTVVVGAPVHNARSYDLCDGTGAVLVAGSPCPSFVDTQVFADEAAAAAATYIIKAYRDTSTPEEGNIAKRFRTTLALCRIDGSMAHMNAYPGWPEKIVARPKPYRVQPIVQRTFQIFWDVYAYPNYIGQWGMHLVCGTVVEIKFFDKIFEFVVPFAAQAELVDLPLVDRSLAVKNT